MFKTKKLIVSMCGILLAVLLFISLTAANRASYAEEMGQVETQDKITCMATINDNFADDSVLVVLDSEISKINKVHTADFFKGVDIERIEDLTARKNNFEYEENEFKQILQIYLKDKSKENVLKAISKIEKLDGVYSAEPNYLVQSQMVPNDKYYNNNYIRDGQWNLKRDSGINAEGAWDITQGSKSVRVGIIDSGIVKHADLNNNLAEGYDFENNDTSTADDIGGHGTQVAGVIGAQGNNGIGVAGINWNVTLIPLQCSYENSKNITLINEVSAIKAINWATDQWGTAQQVDILNYSVGGFGSSITVLNAVASYPGLFVWAAGNFGKNVDSFKDIDKFNLDNIISVGAINKNNERSIWNDDASSSYGKNVSIFAPGGESGVGVMSGQNVPTTNANGDYSAFYGTSCAAPHVTGVAALLLSLNKNIPAKQLKKIILDNADSINITVPTSSGGTAVQTVKKLNAYKAVSALKSFIDSNKNRTFYFVVDLIHSTQPYATTIDKPVLNFNDSYTYTAPESYTYSNEVRNFRHWIMNLNGPNAYDSVKNPWITYTTDRKLSFNVIEMLFNYPDYEVTDNFYLRAVYNIAELSSSCIAEDSLITLADGSRKLVKDLTGEESLLVWNLFTGTFDTAPILCIDSETAKLNDVINLYFSDGTNVKVISEHGFWDIDENKYVYLDKYAAEYIGHTFYKQDIVNNELYSTEVELIDVVIEQEYTTAFSPVTYGHLCYFVNGMLSMPGGIDGLFNIFEVDRETLKYDEAAYLNDIETYGLYTYQEFSEILLVSEELFEAVNGQYLKVAIGKGLVDIDTLAEYIERYSALFD